MTTGNAIFFLSLVILVRWVGDWTITWAMRWRQERKYRKYQGYSQAQSATPEASVGMPIGPRRPQAPGTVRPDRASREDV